MRDLNELTGRSLPSLRTLIDRAGVEPQSGGGMALGHNRQVYNSTEVLPAIYGREDTIDPQMEKALLDRARRLVVEHDLELKRRNVVPISDADDIVTEAYGIANMSLLSLPSRLAAEMVRCTDVAEANRILAEAITEAMEKAVVELIDESCYPEEAFEDDD